MHKKRVETLAKCQYDKPSGLIHSVEADGFATLRFSSEDLPAGERAAVLRDVGRKFLGVDIEPLPNRALSISGTLRTLPGLGIMSAFSSGVRAKRTKELIADSNDCFCFGIVSVGTSIITRGEDVATLEHGDATLLSAAEPSSIVCPGMVRLVAVCIPSASLTLLVSNIEAAIMRPISRGSEALKLLEAYLGLFEHELGLQTPDLRRHAANHIYDLVALAIGATREATEIARDRGVGTARLRGIKADIMNNLGRADLSISIAAARHGLTPRYVRKLFEAEGLTFSEFLLSQRLQHAHRLLTDPRYSDRTISSIAFESGFNGLSYFNRAFRRAFGASPTEVRTP
jgi:AraC-like DNA-binding protein